MSDFIFEFGCVGSDALSLPLPLTSARTSYSFLLCWVVALPLAESACWPDVPAPAWHTHRQHRVSAPRQQATMASAAPPLAANSCLQLQIAGATTHTSDRAGCALQN